MRMRINTKIVYLSLLSIIIPFIPSSADAAVKDWQRSASIMSRGPSDFGTETFRQSVRELKNLNPTHVTLIITLTQKSAQSTSVYAGDETPTDEALISGITYIHSLGLKTHLKFHIETEDHAWRAYINPPDSVRDVWFASYGSQMKKYAAIANTYGVDMMTLGAELTNMAADDAHPKNTERWQALIREVRGIFSGKLTYCANSSTTLSDWTNEKGRVKFWPSLDYIGISAYHGMTTSNPTVERFKEKWDLLNKNDYAVLHNTYDKQIVLCEVGYRNVSFAHTRLYDYWTEGSSNEQRQADLYQALFSYWNDYDSFAGAHLWHWSSDPTYGGPENIDYTPRGKMAEQVIASWWGGIANGPVEEEPAEQFKLRARGTPKPFLAGKEMKIYATIENLSRAREGLIIDIEVYDESGNRVYQRVHENKEFALGQSKTYEAKWTPEKGGLYTVKVGVFKSGWEKVYAWRDDAALLFVSEVNTADDILIYSPEDGSSLAGVQQFKASIENKNPEDYAMYWRVDEGDWNSMNTNGSLKEASVDLSAWKWNTTNKYKIEFMAKDKNGSELDRESVIINIPY